MIFSAPLVLFGLAALPGLYFLLRLTPPAVRRIKFPPLALLRGLTLEERTPARMPWWLLVLRLILAAVAVIGLAGPSFHPPPALPGHGPVLLVVDNGWASARDWPVRRDQMLRVIDAAQQAGRPVALLATVRDADNHAPSVQGPLLAAQAKAMAEALLPEPWPVDREGAARALSGLPDSTRLYLADGLTDGDGFGRFMQALRPDRIYSDGIMAPLLGPAHLAADGAMHVSLWEGPANARLLAVTASGDVLANAGFSDFHEAVLALPVALRNRVDRLQLDGAPTAGGTVLLDHALHGAVVGLLASAGNADTPYLGGLFYVRRALPVGSEVVTGSFSAVLAARPNVVIAADVRLDDQERLELQSFIEAGGVLIRFAGPLTAAVPDGLSPDPLLAGERRLGGALTWSAAQPLAPFPPGSPFAGLKADDRVTVSRQTLADPAALDPVTVWASLRDGTPLVLGRAAGQGFEAAILTSANTDWSNLAISGLFPAILGRLVGLSEGAPPVPGQLMKLARALDGYGALGAPAGQASLRPEDFLATTVSPLHPPGVYADGAASVALNLGGHVPAIVSAPLPGAVAFGAAAPPLDLGPYCLLGALCLLLADMILSLRLRGLLRGAALSLVFLLTMPLSGHQARADNPALTTTLAYVVTGNQAVDQTSADGLGYLSASVSAHSAAQLGPPAGVVPGQDDISLYPLLYWPVVPGIAPPGPAACDALRRYMQHGGLLVIDQPGGDADAPGSGAGLAPGAASALAAATSCLDLPELEPLTSSSVLAHCFYIIPNFAGKFEGAPVLLATGPARDADGVSPVIIGQNDWAGAWARDAYGVPEQTPLPDGEAQRVIADRFGTNLVIYALTGDYKADQAALPAMLDHLTAP